jgi:PAS domain S-box-containing protein
VRWHNRVTPHTRLVAAMKASTLLPYFGSAIVVYCAGVMLTSLVGSYAYVPLAIALTTFGVLLIRYRRPAQSLEHRPRLGAVVADKGNRRRSDETSHPGESELRSILEGIPGFIAGANSQGEHDFANRRLLEYVGMSQADAAKMGWLDLIHPDERDAVRDRFLHSIKTGETFDVLHRMRRFDGAYRWFHARAEPTLDAQGRVSRWYGLIVDVDDQKKAEEARLDAERRTEEALRAGEAQFRRIVDGIPGHVIVMSPTGQVEHLNHQVLEYFGMALGDLKDWAGTDAVHRDDLPRVIAAWKHSVETGHPYDTELRLRRADGVYRWFHARGLPVRSATGDIERWYLLETDIEEQKCAEEALRTSEQSLSRLIETLPAMVWRTTADGETDYINRRLASYTGTPVAGLVERGWENLVHPDELDMVVDAWDRARQAKTALEVTNRIRAADGTYRWFHTRAEPMRDEAGDVVNWYGVDVDVDERKQAERLLAGEKRLLEMVASGQPLVDTLGALCRVVEEIAEGCHCSVVLPDQNGATVQRIIAPSLPSDYGAAFIGKPVIRAGSPCTQAICSKTQVIAADVAADMQWNAYGWGTIALAHGLRSCWSTPVLSLSGEALGCFGIYQREPASPSPLQEELIARFTHLASIAIERAQSENMLRQSEAFLAEAQRISLTGSFSWRLGSSSMMWSAQMYRIFGIEPTVPATLELMASRVHPEELPRFWENVERLRNGIDLDFTQRLLMPDGSVKHLHVVSHAMREASEPVEYVGAVQDVTERQLADEALRATQANLARASQIATVSQLAASIAHEINQPLGALVANAHACQTWLLAQPPNLERAALTVDRIIRDANFAAEVVERIRALFKRSELNRTLLNLNEVIAEVSRLMTGEASARNVRIDTDLEDDLPLIWADRVQMQQVIANLARNGVEAMETNDSDPKVLSILSHRDEAKGVVVEIRDHGPGLEEIDRVFEPFFSTKENGMGMGLAICRSIVEAHQGQLWATKNEPRGTIFSFALPGFSKD